jgi:hypothetical protein
VSVADVRVAHEVKLADFTKGLEKPGESLREMSDRQRIRSILAMLSLTIKDNGIDPYGECHRSGLPSTVGIISAGR